LRVWHVAGLITELNKNRTMNKREVDKKEENKQCDIHVVSGSLPTDEEISKQAKKYDVEDMNDAINRIGGFIVGAKWMRDFISGNDR